MKKAQLSITPAEPSHSRNSTISKLHSLTQSRHTAIIITELYNVLCSAYLIAMAYALYSVLGGSI